MLHELPTQQVLRRISELEQYVQRPNREPQNTGAESQALPIAHTYSKVQGGIGHVPAL